jgi:hypothetical protein
MKHSSVGIAASSFLVCLACSPRAQAGHGLRIDEGNGTGCMSTWTTVSDPSGAAAFSPGGSFGSEIACTPNSGSPADLFPNGVSANDASTAIGGGALYLATGGEMFQFYSGAPSATPTAQVVTWTFANSDTEVEMNGWCGGGAAGSFTWGATSYKGGCGSSPTDFLFNSSKVLIGFVEDNSTTSTVELGSAVPTGWTASGGGTVSAPEIDSSSAMAALTLLAGGLAVLRGRRPLKIALFA